MDARLSTAAPEFGYGVLVLGLPSLTTTDVTTAIRLLGVQDRLDERGPPPTSAHLRLGAESKQLSNFHSELLGQLGGSRFAPPETSPETWLGPKMERARTEARQRLIDHHPTDPWVWADPRLCLLVPFWESIVGAQLPRIIVVPEPDEVASAMSGRAGISPEHVFVLVEHNLRQALRGCFRRPVYITSRQELVGNVTAWSARIATFLTSHGLRIRGTPPAMATPVRPHIGAPTAGRTGSGSITTPESVTRLLVWIADRTGPHDAFDLADLPDENQATRQLLAQLRRDPARRIGAVHQPNVGILTPPSVLKATRAGRSDLRVALWPLAQPAGAFYRLLGPAGALQAQGHLGDILCHGDGIGGLRFMPRVEDIANSEADVVVFQRPTYRSMVEAIRILQARGVAVVVDIDDDLAVIDPDNKGWRGLDPEHSPDRNREWLMVAADLADLVTVTAPPLLGRYATHGRGTVVPNCIPESFLSIQRDSSDDGVVIGWPGEIATHPGDIEQPGDAVARALRDTTTRFRAIGDPATLEALGVQGECVPFKKDLMSYANEVARLGIGIVPLRVSQFNQSKSWLKGLEFAGLGVPFVASPLPEYRSLAAKGAGLLASDPSEWYSQLHHLIENPQYRNALAESGRTATRSLTIEANAERWLLAWTTAVANRRAKPEAAASGT